MTRRLERKLFFFLVEDNVLDFMIWCKGLSSSFHLAKLRWLKWVVCASMWMMTVIYCLDSQACSSTWRFSSCWNTQWSDSQVVLCVMISLHPICLCFLGIYFAAYIFILCAIRLFVEKEKGKQSSSSARK